MYQSVKVDERFCLLCLKNLQDDRSLSGLLFGDDILCASCRKQIVPCKKIYDIGGVFYHILYEYNDFLETVFFQYKEQRDVVLSSMFLHEVKKSAFRKYCLCGLCSSDEKYMERGFLPLELIFDSIYFPLYKNRDYKQSNQKNRKKIKDVIQLKTCYPLPRKKKMIVDDVCTSGASLKRAISLLGVHDVFVISAHPIWLENNKENVLVEKKPIFW